MILSKLQVKWKEKVLNKWTKKHNLRANDVKLVGFFHLFTSISQNGILYYFFPAILILDKVIY